MDYKIKIPLMRHQESCVQRFLSIGHGGMLNSSEPGTGKTLTSIAVMNCLPVKKVLIVCPNSVKRVWANEIKDKSLLEWGVAVLDGHSDLRLKSIKQLSGDKQVIVTNYESLLKLETVLTKWGADLVILDEAHAIKNHKSKRTKIAKKIKSRYRIALTGTPIANTPLDIWSIIDWANPGVLVPNYYAFRNRYCNVYTGAGFPIISGYKNLDELKGKIDSVSFKALKSECLDLPEKVWIKLDVELSENELIAYRAMAEDMIFEVGDSEISASTALVKLLRLQQIVSGYVQSPESPETGVEIGTSKLDVLNDILEELEGRKVVVWCKFKSEVRRIAEMLKKNKRRYVVMTGDSTVEERDEAIYNFQKNDGEGTVFVGTIQTGGVGITLTAASYMVYFSNSWSLVDRVQSSDRIHRIGQTNKCIYYDIIAKNTIDSRIYKVINNKITMADKMTGKDLKNILFDVDS